MEKLYPWRTGAITEILSNCLVYATNIDKALKNSFKSSPKLGKKDRVFITEHSYNILRHLYAHSSTDLSDAIYTYFEDRGFDVSRMERGPNTVDLDPDEYDGRYSVPVWVLKEFSNNNDESVVESVFEALNQRKHAFIRINTNEISVEDFLAILEKENILATKQDEDATCLAISEECIVALSQSEYYNRGYYEYQDFASQSLINHVWPHIEEAKAILDLCAGEGGKSVQLAQAFPAEDRFAYDIVSDKTKHLKRRFERFKNTKCPSVLSKEELNDKNDFDFILIDAPCSGTGTFGRLPTQKHHLTEKHFDDMQRIQKQLLTNASDKVLDGGFIAYSTCSILSKENQQQVQSFLTDKQNYTLITEKQILPTSEHDGLYVALMQKSKSK
jgi:16S rRNA (cytosine967-C5)-methyltransferase